MGEMELILSHDARKHQVVAFVEALQKNAKRWDPLLVSVGKYIYIYVIFIYICVCIYIYVCAYGTPPQRSTSFAFLLVVFVYFFSWGGGGGRHDMKSLKS